jgi:hypothetical protein
LIRSVVRSCDLGGHSVPARRSGRLCQTAAEASAGGMKERHHMNTRTIAIVALVLVVIIILFLVL